MQRIACSHSSCWFLMSVLGALGALEGALIGSAAPPGSETAAPVPVMAMTPPSPLFVHEEVRFDASDSSAPDSAIRRIEWDFGDGTPPGTGTPVRHTYRAAGSYPVVLTVENSEGVRRSVTNTVEVVGPAVQWQRFFGESPTDTVNSLVAMREGGVMLAGKKGERGWVFRVDGRGRLLWEDDFPVADSEARMVISGTGSRPYVVGAVARIEDSAGGDWLHMSYLGPYDANGYMMPDIPLSFGGWGEDRKLWCVATAADGGFVAVGEEPGPGGVGWRPWLGRNDWGLFWPWSVGYDDLGQDARAVWVVGLSDGGAAFAVQAEDQPDAVVRVDAKGNRLWSVGFDAPIRLHWVGLRHPPEAGLAAVGTDGRDIALYFLTPDGRLDGESTWTGNAVADLPDWGRHAVQTPDGGFLITGAVSVPGPGSTAADEKMALVKTDAKGRLEWMEVFPSQTTHDEGIASVVMADGRYMVLGRRGSGSSRGWLLCLANNRPPEPRISVVQTTANSESPEAQPLFTFDASDSTDADGIIVDWRWKFSDGYQTNGVRVQRRFSSGRVHKVELTVVDEDGAEAMATRVVRIGDVEVIGDLFLLSQAETYGCSRCGQIPVPLPGEVPDGVVLSDLFAFSIRGRMETGGTRTFRVGFFDPVPADYVLYRLPDWESVPFQRVDPYTIEVTEWMGPGEGEWLYVMARRLSPPWIRASVTEEPSWLGISFETTRGLWYRIEHTGALDGTAWSPVPHAWVPGGIPEDRPVVGYGGTVTVYVVPPSEGAAFYRVRVEEAAP